MNYNLLTEYLQFEVAQLDNLVSKTTNIYDCLLLNEISNYIISSGGKRLRPLILLLAAKMFGYPNSTYDNNHINLAAAIELIHTATLLHDDVVDNSKMRRNKTSAHLMWGIRNSIIAGDWLFALAFDLVVGTKNINAIKIVANMTKVIAKGELEQLYYKNNYIISEDLYFTIIAAKTGILFEAATQLAAIVTRQPLEVLNYARLFGLHLGLAFQIKDDLLDYLGSSELMGKNLGDDLRDGKLTLPMIYLRDRNKGKFNEIINKVKNNQLTKEDLISLQQVLIEHDVINDSYAKMISQQDLAIQYLNKLPDNVYKQTLHAMVIQMADRHN